jgi:hypothetical protein
MNKITQFWALLKFQVAINPFVIFFPLAMGAPYITSLTLHNYHPGLYSLLLNQNLFLVGIIGFLLLAPEIMRSGVSAAAWPTGTEFILTRAVDRHLVFRARSVFFYFLVLAIPLFALLAALRNPSLQISEYDKSLNRQVLDHLPGSILAPLDNERQGLITIPNGNTLVESWRSLQFLYVAIGTQVFVLLIHPLKYRKFILWGTYLALTLFPLLTIMSGMHKSAGPLSSVTIFFAFAGHQWLAWLMATAALILGQVWCERRFASLEH